MATTVTEDDLQHWMPAGICPAWGNVPNIESCPPWDECLERHMGALQPNKLNDLSNELWLQHPNEFETQLRSQQMVPLGDSFGQLQTSQLQALGQPSDYGDLLLENSGPGIVSARQYPTRVPQPFEDFIASSRATDGTDLPSFASGAIQGTSRNSRGQAAVTRNLGHHPTASDLPRRPKKYVRHPQRTCEGVGPTSRLDAATTKEHANRAHTLVERRYREGLNTKLVQLEETLSHVQQPLSGLLREKSQQRNVQDKPGQTKKKKSDVLHDAMSYVHQSEVDMRHLTDEVKRLSTRIQLLEKLVNCEDCPLVKQMSILQLQGS